MSKTRRSTARRGAANKPPQATLKFGAKGDLVRMPRRKVDTVRREGLRLYEDGTYADPKARGTRPLPRPPKRRP